jgi:hypothetical protein
LRLLPQPGDPRALADDLGQDGLLAVVRVTRSSTRRELAQQPGQLLLPRFEEIAHERLLVVEDDPEAKRKRRFRARRPWRARRSA